MARRTLLAAVAAAALAGCGSERNTDVAGFTQAAETPEERAVLETIATYRTTEDEVEACDLVTDSFIRARFEGEVDNCHQVLRTASRHLPDQADVEAIENGSARVRVDEPTATQSVYEMRREGGVWKIDDIVEAPR